MHQAAEQAAQLKPSIITCKAVTWCKALLSSSLCRNDWFDHLHFPREEQTDQFDDLEGGWKGGEGRWGRKEKNKFSKRKAEDSCPLNSAVIAPFHIIGRFFKSR